MRPVWLFGLITPALAIIWTIIFGSLVLHLSGAAQPASFATASLAGFGKIFVLLMPFSFWVLPSRA